MEKLAHAVTMFVAISKTLDDESTRFTGTFKHNQKKAFTILADAITHFNLSIKENMYSENIDECEQIQNYIHDLVYDMINDGAKDLSIFVSLCKVLKIIYMKYVYTDYKHNDRERFITLYTTADYFARLCENDAQINTDIENFCMTLINGETFKRTIIFE